MTPGGFHSFENRWALPAAFALHLQLGKANVQTRIHQLNSQLKEGMAKIKGVHLYTPQSSELSSGLVCFDVDGVQPMDVVRYMYGQGVVMTTTPYHQSYARFATSLLNTEQELEHTIAALERLASGV